MRCTAVQKCSSSIHSLETEWEKKYSNWRKIRFYSIPKKSVLLEQVTVPRLFRNFLKLNGSCKFSIMIVSFTPFLSLEQD
jgi:hypothetical protein